MVNKLSDNDILNYLMTSEFNEGLTPDEFKFLLIKFRYFYRLNNCKKESLELQLDTKTKEVKDLNILHNRDINILVKEKNDIEKKHNDLINRKLSWKERFSGKIIIKKDEIR